MKLIILSLLALFLNCSSDVQLTKNTSDYSKQITAIKTFAKNKNYNQEVAFMIDYSLHSGLPRFFVVNLKNDLFINKGLVCHGDCKGKNTSSYAKQFSNTNESHCTSLGFAVVGKRDYSKWGKNYKYWLNGLEKTNNNMQDRVVVLHAWSGVPDKSVYPESIATSFGCPTVSINFLDKLDTLLQKEENVLLYSFK